MGPADRGQACRGHDPLKMLQAKPVAVAVAVILFASFSVAEKENI